MTWYKDDNYIDPNLTPRIQQVWFDYALVLSGAQPRDTGQYRCNASNGLDFATATAPLLVQGKSLFHFPLFSVHLCLLFALLLLLLLLFQMMPFEITEEISSLDR